MTAYYNEFDPYAAQWLRNLIHAGHIAPGIVDERSIEDVIPTDLQGFAQCHFFAGIGIWSLALRRAGWPDSRPVWTGSCPCQPFSAAGAGAGLADPRHLWPTFAWLIKQCGPPIIFGEQVASKAVEPWVDLVHADMEALEYAFGAIPFPAAGVGSPNVRDRLFWVANSAREQRIGRGNDSARNELYETRCEPERLRDAGRLANANDMRLESGTINRLHHLEHHAEPCSSPERVGDTNNSGLEVRRRGSDELPSPQRREVAERPTGLSSLLGRPGPVNGIWAGADWISCRDNKWRPIEPGLVPLVNGAPGRVGRLRAYGNAINAEAAKEFIAAYLECQP